MGLKKYKDLIHKCEIVKIVYQNKNIDVENFCEELITVKYEKINNHSRVEYYYKISEKIENNLYQLSDANMYFYNNCKIYMSYIDNKITIFDDTIEYQEERDLQWKYIGIL